MSPSYTAEVLLRGFWGAGRRPADRPHEKPPTLAHQLQPAGHRNPATIRAASCENVGGREVGVGECRPPGRREPRAQHTSADGRDEPGERVQAERAGATPGRAGRVEGGGEEAVRQLVE